jgi:hypothetical protein
MEARAIHFHELFFGARNRFCEQYGIYGGENGK